MVQEQELVFMQKIVVNGVMILQVMVTGLLNVLNFNNGVMMELRMDIMQWNVLI